MTTEMWLSWESTLAGDGWSVSVSARPQQKPAHNGEKEKVSAEAQEARDRKS